MMVGWNFSAGLISLNKAEFQCSASSILILCGWLYKHHSPCILPDHQASQFSNIFTFSVCWEPDFHNAPHFFVSRPGYDLFFLSLIFFNHIIFQWGNSGYVQVMVGCSVFTTCKQCSAWHGLLWGEKSESFCFHLIWHTIIEVQCWNSYLIDAYVTDAAYTYWKKLETSY